MQTVYIDASSAILLYKAELFVQCTRYFSMVMETDVFKEVGVPNHPGANFFLSMVQKNRIKVCRADTDRGINTDLPHNLDLGERQTIVLYFQNICPDQPSFIIMDDAKGAKFCLNRKVPFINALLVPKVLWLAGLLNKEDYLDKTALVIEKGRYAGTIIEKAKALSPSDLAIFTPTLHKNF